MDVINKLYSSVSSTVSQLSGVLPGNPVIREFEVVQHIASAGPGLLWKIYSGYKKSTRQEASIFVLEKRILERWNKGDREMMLETLKRGVMQLTKLRHPQILIVQHPLEESRESLAFATEPVFASLANILGNVENLPQPIPSYLKDYKLFEVEIKYGLLQICEGLTFLHNDVKLLHHNICPESVVINQQGAWKIFGFDFCIQSHSTQDKEPYWPFTDYCPAIHHLTQPNLDFLAPEYSLTASHSSASDIYSLGMLIYCLHGAAGQPIGILQGDYGRFKKFVQDLKHLPASKLQCIPEELRDYVKLMLNVTPELRPDAHQFIKIPFFEDVGVKTLNYLDSSFQWDNLQKSQFFKGLPQIIQKLPHRVSIYRVLPCLVKEFVNPPMVPFVLPNVLLIAENSKKEDFVKYIFPHLRTVMAVQEPIQILLIFMQKMELLLKLTPAEEIKTDVLPLLYRALESDAQQIQELCLSVLPTFASLIDYPAMKNALLPRIKKLCISTNYLSVRVNCLLCIGKLLEYLDKWLVLDEVVPFLPQIPSREPAVLMGILGIYRLALTHKKLGITKEVMATKVLPFLMPLSIENGLTLNQFNALIALVKDMVSRVEVEHRVKLEQLNSIQNESRSFEANLAANSGSLVAVSAPPQTDLDKMYSNLGLEGFSNKDLETKETKIPKLNGSSQSSLTLEDKQRIAKHQETAHRHNTQAAISPTTPQVMAQTPMTVGNPNFQHVKKYNFNQIKTTNPLSVPQNFNSFHSGILSQPQVNSQNISILSSQNMSNLSSQNMSNLSSQNMSNWVSKPAILPANQWDSNLTSNSSAYVAPIPIKKQWPGVNPTQASLDLSAFDSLLPQTQSKIPMNQMAVHKMPLLNSTGDSTNNNKQLTNNDIMDFLG